MGLKMSAEAARELSVIIPAYNAANWIEPTVTKIHNALQYAHLKAAEIIIIDDGSSDETYHRAQLVARSSSYPIKIIQQKNEGRFIARKQGVMAATYDTVLFVDTRVWVDESSIDFVMGQQNEFPDRLVWNGHVNVAKKGNIIARFGDAITYIGWRKYFGKPRLTSYGLKDFDLYPKGTGYFMVPKEVILEAISWFESVTIDVRNSSDDTLLIRHIAEKYRIWIAPEFSCTYFARTTLRAFLKHSYGRGQFFVDGFLRRGTRFYYPLLLFLILGPLALLVCIVFPFIIIPLLTLGFAVWVMEFVVALLLGVGLADALSLFLLSVPFAIMYGSGIWKAVIRKIV